MLQTQLMHEQTLDLSPTEEQAVTPTAPGCPWMADKLFLVNWPRCSQFRQGVKCNTPYNLPFMIAWGRNRDVGSRL